MSRDSFRGRCCVDCLQWLANGELPPDWTDDQKIAFKDSFDAATAGCEVTLGMLRQYHDCLQTVSDCCMAEVEVVGETTQYYICKDCYRPCNSVQATANDLGNECECEDAGFRWSSCDTCDSGLGGDRFYVTFWTNGEKK
jgi:hypothetical protein